MSSLLVKIYRKQSGKRCIIVEPLFRQYTDDHLEIFSNTITPSKLLSTATGSCSTRFRYYMVAYEKDILNIGRSMLESGVMYVL